MTSPDDFADLRADLGGHAAELVRAAWGEAARTLSRQGLDNWLAGARALHALGRGVEPVASFIQEAPAVAREVGEDVLPDLVRAALLLSSKTSGGVIAAMIAAAPVAARRLGDPELFRAWLQFLGQLVAQAPRGVRPMLERLDRLLGQLTLGGLRRWAFWGAQAHRTDYPAQERYFSLASPDALSVLQQQRKGTLFVDVQRRLGMYLRALWGRDFWLRPSAADLHLRAEEMGTRAEEAARPFIESRVIHLADACEGIGQVSAQERYRAAAAHAAAHLVYTRQPLSAQALSPLQMAAIELIEDARVEALAMRDFPGLAMLWRGLHQATPERGTRIGDWFDRIARALLDPMYDDPHELVRDIRLLWAQRAGELASNHDQVSWEIGVALAHRLSRLGIAWDPLRDRQSPAYRDDNRYIWRFAEIEDFASAAPWQAKQVIRRVSLMEFVNEVDVETAGDDAQEIWILPTELHDDDGGTYNAREGREPAPQPHHYPEWDYQIQLERPTWCTVLERRSKAGDPAVVDAIVAAQRPLVSRLKLLIEALQPQGVQRLRKQEDGDEIDLNAAVRALVDLRTGQTPDLRIGIRHLRKLRDISVLLLLDLSESTNDRVRGGDSTVLELSRQASALLADALAKIGDPFALHGFASDGRHDVGYVRFKDFDQPWGAAAKARLAGMHGGRSTRMGAALRHAGALLRRQPSRRKLLLVLTDGEPADVDVRDPQYLRHDARKAVEALGRDGVTSFCLSLDPHADEYVARIFGANRSFVLDNIQRLPERLPLLYMSLTR
jgi:hypothetical protein